MIVIKKFDIIVSNPPYIPAAAIAGLAADVQKEPLGALDGGADGLDFYRRIVSGCEIWLQPDGLLAFEVGIDQAQSVCQLCRQAGLIVTAVRKDYAEIERMGFCDERRYLLCRPFTGIYKLIMKQKF